MGFSDYFFRENWGWGDKRIGLGGGLFFIVCFILFFEFFIMYIIYIFRK